MSMSPNNPFDKNSPSNSEQHPPEQKPANAKSRNGCLIAVVVVLLLSVLVCCGGGVALYYFAGEVRIGSLGG